MPRKKRQAPVIARAARPADSLGLTDMAYAILKYKLGGATDIPPTGTAITSLPYTISGPGSYYLATNLTCDTGTAINVLTNGAVTIDGNNKTLTFSTSHHGCAIAKEYWSGALTVKNITITQGGYVLTPSEYSYGISIAGNIGGLTVTDSTFNMTKSESNNCYARAICYNDTTSTNTISLTVTGCTFNLSGNGNTCGIQIDPQTGASAILTGEISGCTFNVTNNTIEDRRGYCIDIDTTSDIATGTAFEIHNNNFNGSAEVHSFNFLGPGAAGKIYSNVFDIDSDHSHAIRMGRNSLIYSNTFTINSGNALAGELSGAISGRYHDCHDNEIYDNDIYCTGTKCQAYYCGESNDPGTAVGPPANNNFHDNHIEFHGNSMAATSVDGGSEDNTWENNEYVNLDGAGQGYEVICTCMIPTRGVEDTGYFHNLLFRHETGITRMSFSNSVGNSTAPDATVHGCGSPTITITGSPAPIITEEA